MQGKDDESRNSRSLTGLKHSAIKDASIENEELKPRRSFSVNTSFLSTACLQSANEEKKNKLFNRITMSNTSSFHDP
jgi:hypothetical protein